MGRGRNGAGRGRGGRPGVRAGRSAVAGVPAAAATAEQVREANVPPAPVTQPEVREAPRAALLGPSRVSGRDDWRTYEFTTADGNNVRMDVMSFSRNSGTVSFAVNDSNSRSRYVDGATQNAISMRLLQHMREDARTRPDGYTYGVTAYTADNFGAERARAYQAVGYSRPVGALIGEPQYAVVRGGKLKPDVARLREREGTRSAQLDQMWEGVQARVQTLRRQRR